MSTFNRRRLLRTGGVVGATAALGAIAPRAWAWSSSGSIAGTATTVDPAGVWDAPADDVVKGLLDRGAVPTANEALAGWVHNADAVPAAMPADARDFIADARQLPAWADRSKLLAAAEFNKRHGDLVAVLYGMGSGMMSCLIPREARAVYYSRGGANMKDRIAKTAKLGYDIGAPAAYEPTGSMVVTAVKTRLVHAGVRNLLPASPYWKNSADQPVPISQLDMLVTWHSLASFVMAHLELWQVPMTAAEKEAYLHLWQVSGHMLGIQDRFIPATWADAYAQKQQVLDPILAPTSEGLKLAQILVNLGSDADGGFASRPLLQAMTRQILGDQYADMLAMPRQILLDASIKAGWPPFVAMRNGGSVLPVVPELYNLFDEFLRQGTLFYLSEGRRIDISIPDGNRTTF